MVFYSATGPVNFLSVDMNGTGLRVKLEDFAGRVFESLGRKDQRAKGGCICRADARESA